MNANAEHKPMTVTASVIYVELAISEDELLKLYNGSARQVVARSTDGRTLRFPAMALKPYVTRAGVHGRFKLTIDTNNKLLSCQLV